MGEIALLALGWSLQIRELYGKALNRGTRDTTLILLVVAEK